MCIVDSEQISSVISSSAALLWGLKWRQVGCPSPAITLMCVNNLLYCNISAATKQPD